MSNVLKREVLMMPMQTSCGAVRRDREGRPIEPAAHELFPVIVETVEPDEATKARRRMLAAQRAAGIAS